MQIFTPTYGRSGSQSTYPALVGAGLKVTLVVQNRERDLYSAYPHVAVLPPNITTIAPTRQYILDSLVNETAFCMVDDDLVFFRRRDDEPTKLRDISPNELWSAFADMTYHLEAGYAHVGFAAREGANRDTDQYRVNTRIMRVLGYNADNLREEQIRFDDMEVMEDFHVALLLLEAGYKNLVLNWYAHNQKGSGSAGGCSHFRTPELHAKNAQLLAFMHPDFVKVVQKVTKGAWGGGTRTDVNIQWKAAYASSQNK